MAFNPFSWFREHQKGFLVGLTILTMIIFIGQFGRGDPIDQVMGWFGASRASGSVVATLNGTAVREGDLNRLAQRRKLASDFLVVLTGTAHFKVADELNKKLSDTAEGNPLSGAKAILSSYRTGLLQLQQTIGRLPPQYQAQFLEDFINRTDGELRQLESYLGREGLTEDDRSLLRRMIVLLGVRRGMVARSLPESPDGEAQPRDSYYFGGSPKPEDLLDFRLWQIQADRLGVKLTDDDVMKELTAEAAGGEVFEASGSFGEQDVVKTFLGNARRDKTAYHPADLLDALREELRVVIAQASLLGSEPGMRGYRNAVGVAHTPALATPDEFLRFFREQRTTSRVKLFPIPVTNFLAEVKGQPSDAELLIRYERGARREASPSQREAGFKLPRRIAVEYVVASPDDPFYKDQARKDAQVLRRLSDPAQRVAAVAVSLTTPGMGKLLPVLLDPLGPQIQSELDSDHGWSAMANNWQILDPKDLEKLSPKLHYSSVIQPAPIAATVAGLHGGPLGGLTSLFASATREELRRGIPYNLTTLLSQADPRQLLGAAALAVRATPPPLSRALIEPQTLAATEQKLASDAVSNNLRVMSEELTKLARKPAEARAYIARAVKDYRLTLYAMPAPNTAEGVIEDLKAKKKTDLEPLRKAMMRDDRADSLVSFVYQLFGRFGDTQFGRPGEYLPETAGMIPDTKQQALFWRSIDKPAEERSFAQVRNEVIEAWRLDRARTLARDRAERLEAELNKLKANPADAERFLREQKLGNTFELDNVAPIVPPTQEVLAGRPTEYRPYQVPPEKADQFPYPPADLAKQLARLTRPGEATVVVDLPARTYYLALLLDRNEPGLADFKAVYVKATSNDTLYPRLLRERRREHRAAVLQQLRREASADLDKDGRFKLPDALRKDDASGNAD